MLYLFCGKPRRADIKFFLKRLSREQNFHLVVREVDIERSESDNLLEQSLWQELWEEIKAGKWDAVVLSPPCNTWSRARCRFRTSAGPPPLRNLHWAWGFPWLSGKQKELLDNHNFLMRQCFLTMALCIDFLVDFLLEHPEDLGAMHAELPASIWQLPELHELHRLANAITFAVYQCHYGAETPKPTRFMTTLKAAKASPFQSWPQFDSKRRYLGPLPSACSHRFHVKKLIGKSKTGAWVTAASAAYPAGLCKWLASLLVSRMGDTSSDAHKTVEGLKVDTSSDAYKTVEGLKVGAPKPCSGDTPAVLEETTTPAVWDEPPSVLEEAPTTAETSTRKRQLDTNPKGQFLNRGMPMVVEWAGKRRELIDGFGLCSPNRWKPELRGAFIPSGAAGLCEKIFGLVQKFVLEQLADVRLDAIKLGLGHIKGSPFKPAALDSLRKSWAEVLPAPQSAMEAAKGQPFFLSLAGQSLELLGDPDFAVLTVGPESFAEGVPVGYDEPLPRTPDVFPPKEKVKPLDETEFMSLAQNYRSAEEVAVELEEKFKEEEKLGRMFPTTVSALQQQFPDREVLVAALGAIRKPNGDVRPLHDATHHVRLNNQIFFRDQLQYPGPADAAALVRFSNDEGEAVFSMSADIQAAHRLVKIRKKDWPLLCCKADSNSRTVWCNVVGTFGVSSASYWWSRLFGALGRLVSGIMQQERIFQLVYVDDLHALCLGERKFLNLWMLLALYEVLGTPFSYHKFSGGLQVQFVGYLLDYKEVKLGITMKRGDWLLDFIASLKDNRYTVYMRRFNEFLGRLGFVSRVLTWLRPFLAPLYSWSSALDKSTVATSPKLVRMVIEFVEILLKKRRYMYTCLRPLALEQEQFRTDAKCADGYVILGGHHLLDGRWFSFRLLPGDAPFLFDGEGRSQWASTSAELLATMVALVLFGLLDDRRTGVVMPVVLSAGTDNQSNEFLMRKGLTTRWPLMMINMQLSELLMQANARLHLSWRPRSVSL